MGARSQRTRAPPTSLWEGGGRDLRAPPPPPPLEADAHIIINYSPVRSTMPELVRLVERAVLCAQTNT